MTNVKLNDEVIRRVDGSLFMERFCLRVEANGPAFLDCRDTQVQYCGICSICVAFEGAITHENSHILELELELDAYAMKVARLEENNATLMCTLEGQRSSDTSGSASALQVSHFFIRLQYDFFLFIFTLLRINPLAIDL